MTEWRRRNIELLRSALEKVEQGYINNAICDLLLRIAEIEGLPEVAQAMRNVPDRTVCGPTEGWVYEALRGYCLQESLRLGEVLRQAAC